jgi:hypothetical protein
MRRPTALPDDPGNALGRVFTKIGGLFSMVLERGFE